jgi:NAD+ kinase
MFAIIGLISKADDFTSKDVICQLSLWLNKRHIKTLIDEKEIRHSAELIIVAGGDGTLLGVVRNFVNNKIPILGINLGRLGFLADIYLDEMFEVLQEVLQGQFVKQPRALLSVKIKPNQKNNVNKILAFNDIVLHRKQESKIIEFGIYINNNLVLNQRADGLIINTATGSTAYALSSGGPIIHPDVQAISLVPICPHTFSSRPFLVHKDSEIRIELSDPNSCAIVSFDAQSTLTLNYKQDLIITQHNTYINLIHPKGYNFFNIVRSKLRWGHVP